MKVPTILKSPQEAPQVQPPAPQDSPTSGNEDSLCPQRSESAPSCSVSSRCQDFPDKQFTEVKQSSQTMHYFQTPSPNSQRQLDYSKKNKRKIKTRKRKCSFNLDKKSSSENNFPDSEASSTPRNSECKRKLGSASVSPNRANLTFPRSNCDSQTEQFRCQHAKKMTVTDRRRLRTRTTSLSEYASAERELVTTSPQKSGDTRTTLEQNCIISRKLEIQDASSPCLSNSRFVYGQTSNPQTTSSLKMKDKSVEIRILVSGASGVSPSLESRIQKLVAQKTTSNTPKDKVTKKQSSSTIPKKRSASKKRSGNKQNGTDKDTSGNMMQRLRAYKQKQIHSTLLDPPAAKDYVYYDYEPRDRLDSDKKKKTKTATQNGSKSRKLARKSKTDNCSGDMASKKTFKQDRVKSVGFGATPTIFNDSMSMASVENINMHCNQNINIISNQNINMNSNQNSNMNSICNIDMRYNFNINMNSNDNIFIYPNHSTRRNPIRNINMNSNPSPSSPAGLREERFRENTTPTSCSSANSGDAFFSTRTDNDLTDNGSMIDLTCKGGGKLTDITPFSSPQKVSKQEAMGAKHERICLNTSSLTLENTFDDSVLDKVVDNLIQSAVTMKTENRNSHLHGKPDGNKSLLNCQKKKSSKKGDQSGLKLDSFLNSPRKGVFNESEKPKSFDRLLAKSGQMKCGSPDCSKRRADLKTESHSSPSIPYGVQVQSPATVPCHKVQSVPETLESGCFSSKSHDGTSDVFHSKETVTFADNKSVIDGIEVSPELKVLHQAASIRSRITSPGSLHRQKSNSKERAMHSRLRKRKTITTGKKSPSSSPNGYNRKKNRGASPKRASSRESHEQLGKKSASKTPKIKKKVRILDIAKHSQLDDDFMFKDECGLDEADTCEKEHLATDFEENPDQSVSDCAVNRDASPEITVDDGATQTDEKSTECFESSENQDKAAEEESEITVRPPKPTSPTGKPTKGTKTKKTKSKSSKHKKVINIVEDSASKAEQGWDGGSGSTKSDSKPKAELAKKKKRYQFKKSNEKLGSDTKQSTAISHGGQQKNVEGVGLGDASIGHSTDPECYPKKSTGYFNRKDEFTSHKTQRQTAGGEKRHSVSPKRKCQSTSLLTKTSTSCDTTLGSSVDAPGFGKKDVPLRTTRSGPVTSGQKPYSEGIGSAQRAKQAKENFLRAGRKPGAALSPMRDNHMRAKANMAADQASPRSSRSTDLDVALGFKRLKSPFAASSSARICRRDSKPMSTKSRPKSEIESPMASPRPLSPKRMPQFTDPMETNVLNVGLSWMVEGIINRLPCFNLQDEADKKTEEAMRRDTTSV